ncbi:hypothetical protein IEO21_09751 [Rhodonia placenta]|uniref:Uncharacterized protein n=1 Tax=Rhodonia placenta TaxID=104341 RepID=A0A8H7NTV4_9APHY|nr:hypothetical protein IEO21_09751 [Postia placenta]
MVIEPLTGGAAPATWTPLLPPSWTQTPHGRQLATLVLADETIAVEGTTLPAAACRSEKRSIEPMSAVSYIAGTSGVDAHEGMLGDARGSAPLRVTEQDDAAELIDIGVGNRGDIAAGEGCWRLRERVARRRRGLSDYRRVRSKCGTNSPRGLRRRNRRGA